MAPRRRRERRQPAAGKGAAGDPTYLVGVGVDGVIVGEKIHLGVDQTTGKNTCRRGTIRQRDTPNGGAAASCAWQCALQPRSDSALHGT